MPSVRTPQLTADRFLIDILMQKGVDGDKPSFEELLRGLCTLVETSARMDELTRVQAATLDADTDVWSKRDDGTVISLTARLHEL